MDPTKKLLAVSFMFAYAGAAITFIDADSEPLAAPAPRDVNLSPTKKTTQPVKALQHSPTLKNNPATVVKEEGTRDNAYTYYRARSGSFYL